MARSIELSPPANPLLASERTQEYLRVYRGWDSYERAHDGPKIVDFDLSGVAGAAKFQSRREVLDALIALCDRFDPAAAADEFLHARIRGSIAYLRALMGEQIPFADYIRETLGVDPVPFPDAELERARAAVNDTLAPFGLAMREQDRERFDQQLVIHDPEQIKTGIVGSRDLWLQRLREAGIPVPSKIALEVQFADVDAYWSNWINGTLRDGFRLRINLHARKRYDRGRPLSLCLHEICGHAAQMSIWRESIASGTMDDAVGLTTVHSPEMFASEALGQTVPDLFDGEWSFPPEFHMSRALGYYSLAVLHNAHLMLYQGAGVARILDYALERLPLSDPESLEVELRDRGVNPLYRTYQLAYAAGEYAIKQLIAGMTADQKRRFFLEIYTKPLTPRQLTEIGHAIRAH